MKSKLKLKFENASSQESIQAIYDHTIEAFSDSPDFGWGPKELEGQIEKGWKIFAVTFEKEIIAAILLKIEEKERSLLSKNTAIKPSHQGKGISHQIKEFIENYAKEQKLTTIFHYCRIDNFRMYGLNERHGYSKTGRKDVFAPHTIEWKKEL